MNKEFASVGKILIAVVCMAMYSALGWAGLQTNKVMGTNFYVYEVKKGDTAFGLAHDYGWDENVINAWNPGILSPIPKGSLLYYPCNSDDSTPGVVKSGSSASATDLLQGKGSERESLYTAKSGDSLQNIASANGVSKLAIQRANPGIDFAALQPGIVMKIPPRGTGLKISKSMKSVAALAGFKSYKVEKGDTWESIASANNVSVDVLKETNKGFELKPKKYIGIPMISDFTAEVETVVEDDSALPGAPVYAVANTPLIKIALIEMEPNTRKDKEFLRGVLLGINNLKHSGTKIDLKVIDGSHQSNEVLTALKGFQPGVVISTAEKETPGWLCQYAKENQVPLANALDVKNTAYADNPYIIQLITPPDRFNDEVAAWIKSQNEGAILVFTGDKDYNDAMAAALEKIWDKGWVRSRSVADLKTMPLAQPGKYVIYSYPTAKQEISDFLDAVKEATTKAPLAEVTVVGRPNWIIYDEALGEKFHETNVQIPARFYMDRASRNDSSFGLNYRQFFNSYPPNTFPVYAAIGYDVARYFIENLPQAGNDLNKLPSSRDSIQSVFDLSRTGSWSGLLNTAVYMVRFLPYEKIVDKTVIR